jgi:hypothetical protein
VLDSFPALVALALASEISEHLVIASEERLLGAFDTRLEVVLVAFEELGDSAVNELTLGTGENGRAKPHALFRRLVDLER